MKWAYTSLIGQTGLCMHIHETFVMLDNKGQDQLAQMCKLIRIFIVHICFHVCFIGTLPKTTTTICPGLQIRVHNWKLFCLFFN